MAETTLSIAGWQYDLRCRDGEEAHLAHLATLVEAKMRRAQQASPGLTEQRALLFAALFLADEINDLKREAAGRQERLVLESDDEPVIRAVESLTGRIEKLRETLAGAANAA